MYHKDILLTLGDRSSSAATLPPCCDDHDGDGQSPDCVRPHGGGHVALLDGDADEVAT
jgi:hypothetical protein